MYNKTAIKSVIVLAFILPIVAVLFSCQSVEPVDEPITENYSYDIGNQTYIALGDFRFQISSLNGNWALDDYKCFGTLVEQIEKYTVQGDYLYITGYYSYNGATYCQNGEFYPSWGWHIDPMTCEDVRGFESPDVPKYLIFNYVTGEVVSAYADINEIPNEQLEVFGMEINEECLTAKTCYEPGTIMAECS